MARGWDSKSVESQIEQRAMKAAVGGRSDDQVKIDSLLLQRTRVLREIRESKPARHLDAALQYLEESLAALGWKK